jgi:hypothetical protein
MRRFFVALGVGVEDVARPLPDVPESVEHAPDGVIRGEHPRASLQLPLKQGCGPVRVRVSEFLRRSAHQRPEEPFRRLGQEPRSPATGVVGQRPRAGVLSEGDGPVVDALPRYTEHIGALGGGPPPVEFQHGQGPAICTRLGGRLELSAEAAALPVGQFEPAHLDPRIWRWESDEQTLCQKTSADLLSGSSGK